MTTTISLSEDTKDRFDELKDELNDAQDAPDHTAGSFLSALLDTWEAAQDGYYDESDDSNSDPIDDAIRDQLQRIESAAQTAEERTGRIEQTLEDMGARR